MISQESYIHERLWYQAARNNKVCFTVTYIPDLILLSRFAKKQIGISLNKVLNSTQFCNPFFDHLKPNVTLCNDCMKPCSVFQDLRIPELGYLKDREQKVEVKKEVHQIFCTARPVPRSSQEDLEKQ